MRDLTVVKTVMLLSHQNEGAADAERERERKVRQVDCVYLQVLAVLSLRCVGFKRPTGSFLASVTVNRRGRVGAFKRKCSPSVKSLPPLLSQSHRKLTLVLTQPKTSSIQAAQMNYHAQPNKEFTHTSAGRKTDKNHTLTAFSKHSDQTHT